MAKKVHARRRRYMPVRSGRHRKKRPKSFTNEEAAKTWAAAHKLESYELKNTHNTESKTKKIIIIQK